jgi:RHS repeat-associated protein
VCKTSNTVNTYYPYPHYEVAVTAPASGPPTTTITRYYFFAGMRVAMRVGTGDLVYLHPDHLGTTDYATNTSGGMVSGQGYYAYGRTRFGSVPTDHQFTGQKLDAASGLYYYGARYYDRTVGMFISPDTLVPDPTNVYDWNRYMYVRGNPLKYNDPSGHIAVCFYGGYQNDQGLALDGAVSQLCSEGLRAGGYDPAKHGTILALRNSNEDIDFALAQIMAAQAANPYEPIIIVGHSWGGLRP